MHDEFKTNNFSKEFIDNIVDGGNVTSFQECPDDAIAKVKTFYEQDEKSSQGKLSNLNMNNFVKYWKYVENKFDCVGWCANSYWYTGNFTNVYVNGGLCKYLFSGVNKGVPKHAGCLNEMFKHVKSNLQTCGYIALVCACSMFITWIAGLVICCKLRQSFMFVSEIEENNTLGIKLCQLLSYENFDINVVENFCKEQLRMINARNDFRQRFQEYVSPENFKQNILELLKEKFIGEGYDDAIINSELKKIDFKICNSSNVANNREPAPRVNSCSTSNNRIISTENRGTSSVIFEITSIGGISAKAVYLGGKRMKVLKGSTIASSTVPSFQLYDLRKEVIKKATKLPNGTYSLLEDYIFDSPSAASKIVYGNSSNGWICWKTKDGTMLKDIVGRE
jgi:hypothetical protein